MYYRPIEEYDFEKRPTVLCLCEGGYMIGTIWKESSGYFCRGEDYWFCESDARGPARYFKPWLYCLGWINYEGELRK